MEIDQTKRDFLITAGKAGVSAIGLGLLGCAHYPMGMVHGSKQKNVTEKDVPYLLETLMIYNKPFYVFSHNAEENELPFAYIPVQSTSKILDVSGKTIRIDADGKYVPVRQTDPSNSDAWDYSVPLRVENSKITGVRGVRAKTFSDLEKKANGKYALPIKTSNKKYDFNIQTIKIAGQEYYFPHVAVKQTNQDGNLNFYNIPLATTTFEIPEKTGQIILLNKEDGIFRPEFRKGEIVDLPVPRDASSPGMEN